MREAAEILGCSKQYVHQLIYEKRLTGKKKDGLWMLDTASVHQYKAGRSSIAVTACEVGPKTSKGATGRKKNLRLEEPRIKRGVKPKNVTRQVWKCAGCGASGNVINASYPKAEAITAHFLASPKCKRVEISLHDAATKGK